MINPRIDNFCYLIGIPNQNYSKMRILWEGEVDYVKVQALKSGKFINLCKLKLDLFALILNTIVFGDPLRIESGISSHSSKPILLDTELGNILSISLDLPSDMAHLSYETGPLEISFGEEHSKFIRSTFTLSN